jgi:hypothetical protein
MHRIAQNTLRESVVVFGTQSSSAVIQLKVNGTLTPGHRELRSFSALNLDAKTVPARLQFHPKTNDLHRLRPNGPFCRIVAIPLTLPLSTPSRFGGLSLLDHLSQPFLDHIHPLAHLWRVAHDLLHASQKSGIFHLLPQFLQERLEFGVNKYHLAIPREEKTGVDNIARADPAFSQEASGVMPAPVLERGVNYL